MVDVLGPCVVLVAAVVREPTAGARMKSMSPSLSEQERVHMVTRGSMSLTPSLSLQVKANLTEEGNLPARQCGGDAGLGSVLFTGFFPVRQHASDLAL